MERERAATTDEGAFCRFRQCSFRQRPRSRRGGAGAHRWRCNAARSPCLQAVAMPTDRQSARCPGARFPAARPRCPPGAAAARRSPTCQPPPRDIGVRSAPTQPPTGSRGALVTDLAGPSADRHARDPVRPARPASGSPFRASFAPFVPCVRSRWRPISPTERPPGGPRRPRSSRVISPPKAPRHSTRSVPAHPLRARPSRSMTKENEEIREGPGERVSGRPGRERRFSYRIRVVPICSRVYEPYTLLG